MSTRLRSPYGVVVTTSDSNAKRMIAEGFTPIDEEKPAATPKRRGRPKKTQE